MNLNITWIIAELNKDILCREKNYIFWRIAKCACKTHMFLCVCILNSHCLIALVFSYGEKEHLLKLGFNAMTHPTWQVR